MKNTFQINSKIPLRRQTLKFHDMNYLFNINYWFRYVTNGEQEKDFENVTIAAKSFEDAIEEVMSRFSSPSRRVFSIDLKSQTPTLTKNELFNLTNPNK